VHLLALGLSHKTAPVAVRERFAVGGDALGDAVARLRRTGGVREVALLSTCNRTEVYLVSDGFAGGRAAAVEGLAALAGWTAEQTAPYLYGYIGPEDVAEHLFRVAAGLDSLVLGETQVLGQVKDAYRVACDRETVGKVLHALFHRALEAAKRIHRETGVGRSAATVSSAAVDLARKTFGDLAGRRVLLVGAGETAELVAHHLQEAFLARILVVNRTPERAEALAARYAGQARRMDELEELLAEVDIVVSSTGAPRPVIGRDALARAAARRRRRPLFVVDIAVPRDVEPEAADIPGVFLYNVDHLEGVVSTNQRQRLREARRAERLAADEAARFSAWVQSLDVVPVIRALREKADAIRAAELERALSRLGPVGERQRAVIEGLAASLVNKLLDGPTRRLKTLAAGPGGIEAARALADLFALPAQAELDLAPPEPSAAAPLVPPVRAAEPEGRREAEARDRIS
jgi:glutamyl-tRNA reductase